jgi:hypothetical protein
MRSLTLIGCTLMFLVLGLLPGCFTARVRPEAEPIRITFDMEQVRRCTSLGEVVGSEGHWYSAWLIDNEVLATAALNDLRNRAHAKGADTVFVPNHTMLFATSVTILGQAYRCKDGRGGAPETAAPGPR